MLSTKLLLVFGLLTGIFVDECDLGDFNVTEFSDQVTVTNASTVGYATVAVVFNHNSVEWRLPAGSSKTASGLAATRYELKVLAPSGMTMTYEERLKDARDNLVALSIDPAATPDQVMDAVSQLSLVVAALQQVQDEQFVQTCSGKITTGVESHATVTYTKVADGTGIWVLDCG